MWEPFDRKQLGTVQMVPLTAYDASGQLNLERQARHIARLYAAGIRVFLPAAGTSEFHSLSSDEVVELVRVTRQACGPDAVVFAPVGMQVGEAIDVARRSQQAGANGILFMPFVHPYISDPGVRDYILQVMDAADAPALIYKKAAVPSDALLLEMADDPRVAGVKYAVNDLPAFRKVLLADHGRIEWTCGTAERFAPFFMLAGATGYTTGAGNLCPHITLAMHAAFAAGESEEGLRLQELILPIEEYRGRAGDSFNISMLKFGMQMLGEDFGDPRPPQRRLTPAEQAEIAAMLEPILAAEGDLQSELTRVGLAKS